MKSHAIYAGDPRHQASEVMRLRERVKVLREEAREDYARAEQAETALVQARAEIAALRKETGAHALTEFAAALRRRQRVDL